MEMKKSPTNSFSDYSLFAETDSQGVLRVLTEKEAIENALRLWLISFPNELIRKPNKGGYVTKWLLKPMTRETQTKIGQAISEGLYEDFQPVLKLKKLEIVPDYENQHWSIYIEAYAPLIKSDINIEEQIRTLR
jgi:hypothetical protein